jgi:hypothetical protein
MPRKSAPKSTPRKRDTKPVQKAIEAAAEAGLPLTVASELPPPVVESPAQPAVAAPAEAPSGTGSEPAPIPAVADDAPGGHQPPPATRFGVYRDSVAGIRLDRLDGTIALTFREKPPAEELEKVRARGFRWRDGSWRLPATAANMVEAKRAVNELLSGRGIEAQLYV